MVKKKSAKTAHRGSGPVRQDDTSASKLVMVDRTHRISKNVTGRTDCGERAQGWRYGTAQDISCQACLGEDEND